MNVTIAKTKAEQAFGEEFAKIAKDLPGSAAIDEARQQAMGAFAALGLPHRRIEEWKYTDLRAALKEVYAPVINSEDKVSKADIDAALGPLAKLDGSRMVFVNGAYRADLSDVAAIAGVAVNPLSGRIADLQRLQVSDSDAVIALNTAFMSDGAIVTIDDNAMLEKPLLLIFARAGNGDKAMATRNVINLGKNAKARLIEANIVIGEAGNGQSNGLSEINVGDGAEITHIKVTRDGTGSTHLSTWIAELGAGASYKAFQMTLDTKLARHSLFVTFNGEGSKIDLSGAFLGRGSEHIDTTLVVDHAVPSCESRELYKGVLDDTARGIFQGKVIVQRNAQKSDGKQMAQALMLSDTCEFDSKPELEIYADDVVCGHGSTSAQLDDELMFYCRSRGIPEDQARALIIESFIGEALDQVEHDETREALGVLARDWLA